MSDAEWFYVDADGTHQGPVAAAFLRSAVLRGQLSPDDLVWCDGMASWMPFRQVEALQVPGMTLPPPIPGRIAAQPRAAASAPVRAAPQRNDADIVVYAGFWRRFFALMIDNLILLVPATLLVAAIGGGQTASAADTASAPGSNAPGLSFYLVYWAIAALYFALQESSSYQATLGKRALGIKVTDLDGGQLTFANALGRWFSAALSYVTLYIGFLMAAFTHRKQALHDVVAGTLVVDRWAYSNQPERQRSQLSGCLVTAIVVLVLIVPMTGVLAAIALPAYQGYVIRTKVLDAISASAPAQGALEAAVGSDPRCPSNGERGVGTETSYAATHISSIHVGTMQNGHCALEVAVHAVGGADTEGRHIWLDFDPEAHDDTRWTCTSDLAPRYLPARCKQ